MFDIKKRLIVEILFIFVDYITCAFILASNSVILEHIHAKERFYIDTDESLSYPIKRTIISDNILICIILFPVLIFACFQIIFKSFHDFNCATLSLIEAYTLTSSFRNWMNLVGVLRPNWLEMLETGIEEDIEFSRTSYPSAHASYSASSLTVLMWFLIGKFKLFHSLGKFHFIKALICISPIILSTYTGLTRVYEYKHHTSDINAGMFIGITCGSFAYFLNYNSPFDCDCHLVKTRSKPDMNKDNIGSI